MVPSLSFVGGTLVLEGEDRDARERLFPSTPWVWDSRAGVWRCDAREYAVIRSQLDRFVRPFDDRVPQWRPVRWPHVRIHSLRPEQEAAVAAWQKTRQGVIVMPTGTGKTEVALRIMADAGLAALVVAPVRDLMYHWHRRILETLGYDAGIIGDNVFRVRPVSVTTYDSAYIHMERLGDQFALVVFDECHHLPGPMRRDAARMSVAPMRLGLTATPERSDSRHLDLDWLIGPVVYQMPLSDARGQTLADYEVTRIPIHLVPEQQSRYDQLAQEVRRYIIERRKTEPQYSWKDLCNESGKTPEARRAMRAYYAKKSIEDRAEEKLRVLEGLFRLHVGEPCLVFAGSNAMARDVSRRFLIPCLLNHCGKKERLEVLRGLEDGTYPALVANQVLDEGSICPRSKWPWSSAARPPAGRRNSGSAACCANRAMPGPFCTRSSAPTPAKSTAPAAAARATPTKARATIGRADRSRISGRVSE